MGTFISLTRLLGVDFFTAMARFAHLDALVPVARLVAMGALTPSDRFGPLVVWNLLARLLFLSVLSAVAHQSQPRSRGWTIPVCPSLSSTYKGLVSSPASSRPTNQ